MRRAAAAVVHTSEHQLCNSAVEFMLWTTRRASHGWPSRRDRQKVHVFVGVHQNFAGIGEVCRANGTLFLADTVCSLGGVPFFADEWGVDAMYSGSQKALAAPPGAAPLMFGERAFEKLSNRKTKVASYMNDLTLIGDYWGWYNSRFYHHTGMISMTYAMREALEIVKVCCKP